MKIIGLTGSIGMGKSATARMLMAQGIPVFDSDAYVHSLLNGHAPTISSIIKRFPDVWDKTRQKIDRKKLGKIVFADPRARKDLESILHPLVWKGQRDFIAKSRRAGHKKIVLDIPLLFETGSNRKCDAILCVTAPAFVQQQRVLSRPNMTVEKFKHILGHQLPDAHKRKLADHVIPTGLGYAFALQSIKKALRCIE